MIKKFLGLTLMMVLILLPGYTLPKRSKKGPKKECLLCHYSGVFKRAGTPSRFNVCCPRCSSYARHRHLWYFLKENREDFFNEEFTLLHWAPEHQLSRIIERMNNIDYIRADIDPKENSKTIKLDITQIDLPDSSVDIVFCSHVLEHVQEDEVAMQETYRVLKPGGYAIFIVPIYFNLKRTFEDPSIIDPKERELYFDQSDHVRKYAPADFRNKLVKAGFDVKINQTSKLPRGVILKYGLKDSTAHVLKRSISDIYYCIKNDKGPDS